MSRRRIPHTVIAIDDDFLALRALQRLLPMPIATSCDFEEGIVLIEKEKPRVAIVDVNLRGPENGLDALRIIRERVPTCDVLLLTGDVRPDDRNVALRSGAAGYLVKSEMPVLREAVLALLDDELDGPEIGYAAAATRH